MNSDWLSLAVVIGDPQCGLVVVMTKDGWRVEGDCYHLHDHVEAVKEAKQRLLTKHRR